MPTGAKSTDHYDAIDDDSATSDEESSGEESHPDPLPAYPDTIGWQQLKSVVSITPHTNTININGSIIRAYAIHLADVLHVLAHGVCVFSDG